MSTKTIDRLVKAAYAHTKQFEIAAAGLSETAAQLREVALSHAEQANDHRLQASRAEVAAWDMERKATKISGLLA